MSRSAIALLALGMVAVGCRGQTSRKPPVHPQQNMYYQEKLRAQSKSPVFDDQRSMRPEVPGTVAMGSMADDDHLRQGLVAGQPARELPPAIRLSAQLLARGRERFDIFCAPCHDRAGTGESLVVKRGLVPPAKLADPRLRAMPIGQLFRVVTRGVRNMPSYAAQIPPADRWAIVTYVRALQIARSAGLQDVPLDVRQMKGWSQ